MRVITLERKTMDGKPVEYGVAENGEDYRDWWCVIETKEEEMVYEEYLKDIRLFSKIWNDMVRHAGQGMGVSWGDDDMYGYIRPDEDCPDIGEEFIDGDGDTWVRVE